MATVLERRLVELQEELMEAQCERVYAREHDARADAALRSVQQKLQRFGLVARNSQPQPLRAA